MQDWEIALKKAAESIGGTRVLVRKGQTYLLPCGTKTYTWLIREGVSFTSQQVEKSDGELANTVWRNGMIIHSLDPDITLPLHALTDTVLLKVYSDELNAKIKSDPELSYALAEHYHSQFRRTLVHYCLAALEPSRTRLKRLDDFFAAIPELKGEKIDDQTMSLFMGMHPVTVYRLRREIQKEEEQEGREGQD